MAFYVFYIRTIFILFLFFGSLFLLEPLGHLPIVLCFQLGERTTHSGSPGIA